MNTNLRSKLVIGLSDLIDKTAETAGKSLYKLESAATKVAETGNDLVSKLPKIKVTIEK